MKTLNIEAPEGHEIDQENSTFERIVFKPIVKKRKWEDFGKVEGYYVDLDCGVCTYDAYKTKQSNRDIWPTKELAEASIALCQLLQWREKIVGDWTPEGQRCGYFSIHESNGCIEIGFFGQSSRLLSFPRQQTAIDFGEEFKDLIRIAAPLL